MYLEIVSPEKTLFNGDVNSVSVPGVNGEFEMLNNHAAVVSTLKKGFVNLERHILNINYFFYLKLNYHLRTLILK